MREAFDRSAPSLKQFAGFVGFELWTSEEENTVMAVSQWESKEAYEGYINSETFKAHHGGASSEQASPHANVSYYIGNKLI
jgi:heme-degrading monooxygenase HmoA